MDLGPGEEAAFARVTALALASYAVAVAIGFVACLALGQDFNFDGRNYHYYNAFAWLADRTFSDVAGGQLQGYFNPLASLPFYLATTHLPPRAATFALVMLWALPLLPLTYVIFAALPRARVDASNIVLCVAGLALAGTSAVYTSQIGASFNDPWLSTFALAALATLLFPSPRVTTKRAAIAGFLTAGVAGLKWGYVFFLVALICVVAIASRRRLRNLATNATAVCIGAGAGIAVWGGFWFYRVWRELGNPVFPMFNAIFRSPYYQHTNFGVAQYTMRSWQELLGYPWALARGGVRSVEFPTRDARWLVAAAACVLAYRYLWRNQALRWLLVYWLVAFVGWGVSLGIHRYAVVLDLLVGPLFVGALAHAVRGRVAQLSLAGAALVVCLATTTVPNFSHVPFTTDWFEVDLPASLKEKPSNVLFASWEPIAFLAAKLHPESRIYRIGSSLGFTPDSPFGQRVEALVDDDSRPLVDIGMFHTEARHDENLRAFGLRRSDPCLRFAAKTDCFPAEPCDFFACPVRPRERLQSSGLRSLSGEAVDWLGDGWSTPEPERVWTNRKTARLSLPVAAKVESIELDVGSVFPAGRPSINVALAAGPSTVAVTLSSQRSTARLCLSVPGGERALRVIDLSITVSALFEPRQWGVEDARTLGVYVTGIRGGDRPCPG